MYPEVQLADARKKKNKARELLENGIDPSAAKKFAHNEILLAVENNFEKIAREWFLKMKSDWSESYAAKLIARLENNVFPWIGNLPIKEITPPVMLSVLHRIEETGALETVRRVRQDCSRIFRYGIVTMRTEHDPADVLKGAIKAPVTKHFASITDPKAIGILLQAINDYQGEYITKCALKLAPLVFVRPVELRKAEWTEIDFEAAEWRISARRMKQRVIHLVPLSKQAIEILRDIHKLTGNGKYVFRGVRDHTRPMSENTVNGALRRLGYTNDEMTGHGFRSMASTILNEQGWNRDAIERQLAHTERNKVRAAYNYAEHLPERRRMMQAWADYLNQLAKDRKAN